MVDSKDMLAAPFEIRPTVSMQLRVILANVEKIWPVKSINRRSWPSFSKQESIPLLSLRHQRPISF